MKTRPATELKPACADLTEGEIFVPLVTSRRQMEIVLSLMKNPLPVFEAWMLLEAKTPMARQDN